MNLNSAQDISNIHIYLSYFADKEIYVDQAKKKTHLPYFKMQREVTLVKFKISHSVVQVAMWAIHSASTRRMENCHVRVWTEKPCPPSI